jgi:nicotinamidase-related amidase
MNDRGEIVCSHCSHTATMNRAALIIVDMSVEQVQDVTYRVAEMVRNIQSLASSGLFDLMVDSRLFLESPDESSLSRVWEGSGTTMFRAGSEGASLIPELRSIQNLTFVRKYNYSCFAGEKCQLPALLRANNNITNLYVCGINTDYCVFATALDAFQRDFSVVVVSDAVSSVRGEKAHEEGLRNLERHFGAKCLMTTEQVLLLLAHQTKRKQGGA